MKPEPGRGGYQSLVLQEERDSGSGKFAGFDGTESGDAQMVL